jgi:hypothetical protein
MKIEKSGEKKDYYVEIERYLKDLKEKLGTLSYKGVPICGVVKLPIYCFLKDLYLKEKEKRFLISIRELLNIFRGFLKLLIYKVALILNYRSKYDTTTISPKRESIIFVIDHNNNNFLEMELNIMKRFKYESLIVITRNKVIFHKLKTKYETVCYAAKFLRLAPVTAEHFRILYKVFTESDLAKDKGLVFKLKCCLIVLEAMGLIDYYERNLKENAHRAIITLNDVQSHECIITNVANMKGIPTFTLQHGMVDPMHVPVYSKRIFIWGETTKKELMNFNVPEKKIVISGRPGLDDLLRESIGKRHNLRKSFFKKQTNGTKKTVVTFIGGNWGPYEEKRLLECFLSICELDISANIKLKPTIDQKQVDKYRRWIDEFPVKKNISLLFDEDIFEIFAMTDVLVGFASSALVEALPFSVICVILDLFEYINLKTILPHYDDCQVVHNEHELRNLTSKIVSDPDYCAMLRNNSFFNAKKYFKNTEDEDASQFIHDYVNDFVKFNKRNTGLGLNRCGLKADQLTTLNFK